MPEQYNLQNKKIFLIIFPFYEYHLKIEKVLNNFGCNVTVVYNQFGTKYAYSQNKVIFFLKYLFRAINTTDISRYLEGKYDFVLALGGYSYDKSILNKLKKNNPELKTVIYYWDSFLNWKSAYTIDWFDCRYSFDHHDCIRYKDKNVQYLPLFYINDSLAVQTKNHEYDILYIGSLSPFSVHRLFWLRKINKIIRENNIKAFLFLYCPEIKVTLKDIIFCITSLSYCKFRFFSFLFGNEPFVSNTKLSLSEIKDIEIKSKCLLDIPAVKQTGISIGVFEALANGKKIITTNKHIMLDTFYKPENIFVLNNKDKNKMWKFINGNSDPIDISYLKIENWLRTLLR
jgi:hypothetical protein